jgi:hypothetical protein
MKKEKNVPRQVGAQKNESDSLLVKVISKKRKEIEPLKNHNLKDPKDAANPVKKEKVKPNAANPAKKEKDKPIAAKNPAKKDDRADSKAADSPIKSKKKIKLDPDVPALAQTSVDTLETSK